MPSDLPSAQPAARSPLLAAIGLSLAIGCGAVLGTTDLATIEDAITGQWLTRAYTETQQGHMIAIAALEQSVGGVAREIDFVGARAAASVRRSEDAAAARLAQVDAEIAALKDRLAGVQLSQLISARPEVPAGSPANENGLRSSLTELTAAHHNSVAAITRRLDRIEVKVGLSTDVAPVAGVARKSVRRAMRVRRAPALPPADTTVSSPLRLDQGHLFTVKPVSQRTRPLRLTKLPD